MADQNDNAPSIEEVLEKLRLAEARAEEEKARAEEAKTRAEEAKTRAEEAKTRAEEAKTRAEEAKTRAEEAKTRAEKASFKYWNTFDDLWTFEPAAYVGLFGATLKFRQEETPRIYTTVHQLLMSGEGIEAILDKNSVFSQTMETESIVTMETNEAAVLDEGNRATKQSMESQCLKNFLGKYKRDVECSKAHGFPKDKGCNMYWWPMLRMVTGAHDPELNQAALDKMAAMKTNKIVFPCPHNHIYDDLKKGYVCTIPIFQSMKEMATSWDYGDEGYEMLIVGDSQGTYQELKMSNDEDYPHITVATKEDVTKATALVTEMTKVLADSLVSNWENHYNCLEDVGGRKKMLEAMKDILTNDNQNQVYIPNLKSSLQEFRLYKIDYRIMYKGEGEGRKYIHDPFPALIKSAVNLSAFVNKEKKCKLLPAYACLEDLDRVSDGVSSEPDILDLLDRSGYLRNRHASEVPSLVGYCSHEITSAVVSDDELEGDQEPNNDADGDDDAKSVISELTA